MKKYNNEKGFTLLESIFVLSVFMIITTVVILMIKPQKQLQSQQLFFSQLKADFFYAQQYAVTNQTQVNINFMPSSHFYVVARLDTSILFIRHYDKNVRVKEGTMNIFIQINSKGNIPKFGTIYFYIGEERYKLTILIGRGRFYVAKE